MYRWFGVVVDDEGNVFFEDLGDAEDDGWETFDQEEDRRIDDEGRRDAMGE